MSNKPLFKGVGTALITPFKNGEIDFDALNDLVEAQLAGGVNALIAAGTTGEPATMDWDENIAVIRAVVEKVHGRVPVIAGTGSNCTREAIEAAKRAKEIGADAQLCVTPYYNKTSQAGLIAHYTALADSNTLPVIVYNVPSRTGLNILPETLAKIAKHPNVIAVKEANADMAQALEKVRLCGEDVAFYSGNDELAWPCMACGFAGVISVVSNMLPRDMADLTAAALRGDMAEATRRQLALEPLIAALFSETSPIPVKAAMAMMGMCQEELRLPLVPMQDATRAKLRAVMADMGIGAK